MKKNSIGHLLAFFLIVCFLFVSSASSNAATGRQLADAAIAALKNAEPDSTSKAKLLTIGWSWLGLRFNDEQYPITVDFVGSNFSEAKKVIYMLPGGGVNFASSFFTPLDNNLAQFFRKAGYLVVGITPREDALPAGISYYFTADWGMAKHKADIQKIISIIQERLKKQYRVLGHSFGAAYALDYASTCTDELFEKVIALDIYSFNRSEKAADSSELFAQMAAEPPYVDASYTDMKSLMLISLLFPKINSGQSRGEFGPGNFTYEGLLYFSLIWSKYLPGVDVSDWPLVQGYAAGAYNFAWFPFLDTYWLSKSAINTLRSASMAVGSGLVPFAVYRDWFDVNGDNLAYSINWSGIKVPIVWLNTELGYGSNRYCGGLITSGPEYGIPGYGHLDIILSKTAQQDVWEKYNLL